jgi:hypothetical protein
MESKLTAGTLLPLWKASLQLALCYHYGKQEASLQLAWEWYLRLFVKVSLVDLMAEDAHPRPVEQIAKSFGRKLFKYVSQAYASS